MLSSEGGRSLTGESLELGRKSERPLGHVDLRCLGMPGRGPPGQKEG